ncbi:MAG: alpha/beta hydrolase [Clostridia bacterium]|nr:alpha/beta hydrolase [Clostridia bacterium]
MIITYKRTDETELKLTFLPPEKEIFESAPLYFIIPGGGWHTESRQSMLDFSEESVSALRNQGFAVVSIDYRVTDDGTTNMYDILEDCFDAMAYVCENSKKLGIDTENVILSGHSAGAHLALMLGYCNPEKFSKNEKNYKVKGIAAMSAPTALYDKSTNNLSDSLKKAFRNCEYDKAAKETSPIEYVTMYCPPTLLLAGTSDYLVFAKSSEMLYKQLLENNAETEMVLSVCGGHSFEKVHGNIMPSIKMEDIQAKITAFALSHISKN